MFVCFVAAVAQSPSASTQKDSPAGKAITVVGCLTGMEGRYTLGTSSDQLYVVEGDPELLRRFNAVTVKVTGIIGASKHQTSHADAMSYQPQTLTVSKIKKVADSCN